jgi:hypothetical protein
LTPEAGYLLTAAFPSLTLAQADAILTNTEGPGGGSSTTAPPSASIPGSTLSGGGGSRERRGAGRAS